VVDTQLAQLNRRYQALRDQLRELGFIAPGSVIERYTTCGTESCRCHGDPSLRHGPYLQYTRKLAGKTITRRLDPEQARHYREWIANRHALEQLIAEMDHLSQQAAQLLLGHHPRRDELSPGPAVTENNPITHANTVTIPGGPGTCPDHRGCLARKCAHWGCSNIIHVDLNRRGQPRRFCTTRCRVAEHRRLN
jgi:Family of unknown function (DUF6788)